MEVAVKNENPAPNAANAPLPQRNQKPQGQQGPQIGNNEPAEKKPRFSDINPNNQNQNQGGGPGGFQQRRNNNRMNNNRNNNNNRSNPQLNVKPEVSFLVLKKWRQQFM